jgi:AcrR family transcriptional regulator
MATEINGERRYDATGRQARAEQLRDEVLECARTLFLERGYAATTVTAVAAASGVSAETVYKAFGGKPGIVRTIFERSLLGSGPGPAELRSDAAQLASTDPRVLFRRLGALSAEVAPLTAPVMRLIRDAAAGGDTAMSTLLQDIEHKRYERMLHNAEVLERRGFLRAEITAMHAADVMWLYTADDVFNNLVVSRRWPLKDYGEFIADALTAALSADV